MPQTMQCPHCQTAVGIPDGAAGARVRCPSCQDEFVVPGMSPKQSDDQDWLSLDNDPVDDFTSGTDPIPQDAAPVLGSKPASDSASTLPESFIDDLPPIGPSPSPFISAGAAAIQDATSDSSLPETTTPVPVAESAEHASEYRVSCPICGSIAYAKAAQAGKKIRCSDCHSDITVPEPPKIKKKVKIDIDKAEPFSLSQVAERDTDADPFRQSAAKLLQQAEDQHEDEEVEDYEVPKVGEWLKSIFAVFAQPAVLFHWLALSFAGATLGGLGVALNNPMVILGSTVVSIFYGAVVVACGFAILQATANGNETVSDWPVALEATEWMSTFMTAVAAALAAIMPAWILGSFTFGANLATVALAMMFLYVMYPFVLLSMLDMQSIFMPFSPEVSRSVTRCQEAWGAFYLSSGLLFFVTFLVFVSGSLMSGLAAAVICPFIGVAATFLYFSMMGRLAYAIGQAVNDQRPIQPADRSRPTDTA